MTWAQAKSRAVSLAHTPRLVLAQKLLRRVPLRPVDVGKLCFLQLTGIPRVRATLLRGSVDVRFATPADIDALAALNGTREAFRARMAAGDRCIMARADGRVVGYEWFCDRPVHNERAWGYRITIPSGYVYAYDAYIDPGYRNTGVWLRFKACLAEWMTASGKRGVLTFVDYGNWPSLRTHLRFGFTPTESVVSLRVVSLRLFRKARAIATAAWSYAAWLAVHFAPAHMHHAVRVLHVVTRRI